MKKIIGFSLLFISTHIHAKCDTGNVVYERKSGFGISLGSGGLKTNFNENTSVNVPLSVNGEPACFRKKNKFSLKAENSTDTDKGKILISPMKLEFENIPDPSVRQYIYVEKNQDKMQTKFHTMSFVCMGEIPLSVEALSDRYSKIFLESKTAGTTVTTVFATGAAADHLKTARSALSSQETFDFFAALYKNKNQKELDQSLCCGQKVPSIISDTSINSLTGVERSIASSFTTLGARVPNGCSKEFSKDMKTYLLENFEENDSLKDYSVKKKWFSDDLIFEWK